MDADSRTGWIFCPASLNRADLNSNVPIQGTSLKYTFKAKNDMALHYLKELLVSYGPALC